MDEASARVIQDVLKLRMMTSRLYALSIANTETIMNMISALAEDPGLTPSLRAKSLDEFKALKNQMDILQELSDIAETNDGR